MAQERGTGALLKVKHGQGRETTFYGGSIHLSKASQKNLKLARKRNLDKQNDKEYHYEVKQLYQKKCSLRQHLLNLQLEKEKVKYLDGGSRGKPRNQWDTSVDDVILRHARATQQFPTRVSKFNDNTKHEKQSQDVLPEPTKSRLVPCGFLTVASEEEIPPKISRKPLALKISNKTRFPNINDNQRVTSSHSDFTPRMRHPGLPHNHTTLETVPSFVLTRRRLSRSLTDLRDLRQRSNTLQSTV